MTRVLLVRHGQSESNILGTFTGHIDSPLTELGLAQAKCTAQFILKNYHVDAIYSSDLQRAYVTGLPVAEKLGLQIHTDTALRELYGGEWEGKHFSTLPQTHPEEYRIWQEDIANSHCPGGESVEELGQRVWVALCGICEANPDKTVLITTHATPIRTILWRTKTDLSSFMSGPWVSNSSVSELIYEEGDLIPVKLSQDGHLAEMKTNLPPTI